MFRFRSPVLLVTLCLLFTLALAACSGSQESASPALAVGTTEAALSTPQPQAEAEPTIADQPTQAAETSIQPAADSALRTFGIQSDQSEVRFILDEELLGSPKTVIGATGDVSGQVLVESANPANSQIGEIRIGTNNFVTDSDRRNGAIRRFILQSGQYPTITFVPTGMAGLPESAGVGERFTFQVTGDLTIRDVTHPVTFETTIEALSETELHLNGSAQILRSDFDLVIPSVPSVANVTNAVQLELELVLAAE